MHPFGTQSAAWVERPGPDAVLLIRQGIAIEKPGPGELLVKILVTGFCHSDVHSIHGETPMTTNVPGHEGVGLVVRIGEGVDEEMLGKRVGIKWLYSACGKCEICRVNYLYCPNQKNSGRNVPGTFQQYVISPAEFTTVIPDTLSAEMAAPLLCAGVTMYGAIRKLEPSCQPGDTIVIIGAGGGLGHIGVQIAKSKAFQVIAIDSGNKELICRESGADEFVDYQAQNVEKAVKGYTSNLGANGVIVAAGAENAYSLAVQLLRPLGTLVCVGLPRRDMHIPASPFDLVVKGLCVLGTSVGNEEDMEAVLELASKGLVKPVIKVYDLGLVNEVKAKLKNFEIQGRVVLRIPQ